VSSVFFSKEMRSVLTDCKDHEGESVADLRSGRRIRRDQWLASLNEEREDPPFRSVSESHQEARAVEKEGTARQSRLLLALE